jgi:hypothetical protein
MMTMAMSTLAAGAARCSWMLRVCGAPVACAPQEREAAARHQREQGEGLERRLQLQQVQVQWVQQVQQQQRQQQPRRRQQLWQLRCWQRALEWRLLVEAMLQR